MGLMYLFPVSKDETDHCISHEDGSIEIHSYGLPPIFWGYLAAIWVVAIGLFIAIYTPMFQMIQGADIINQLLALMVLVTFVLILLVLTSFYFYKKTLLKNGNQLTIIHSIFGIKYKKRYLLKSKDAFEVKHFLATPNYARINQDPNYKGFQNRGYFELFLIDETDRRFCLDRHSRKVDLDKLSQILSSY